MKKVWIGILITGLVLSIGVTSAFAAGTGREQTAAAANDNKFYSETVSAPPVTSRQEARLEPDTVGAVDESPEKETQRAQETTTADNHKTRHHAENNCRYTDADNDGICDLCGTHAGNPGSGHGHGKNGNGAGHGNCYRGGHNR